MSEFNFRWQRGNIRNHFCIRWWYRNPLRGFYRWLMDLGWWDDRPELELRTRVGEAECYCPGGITTDYRLQLWGVGCWGWWRRDWVEHPCTCNKVSWLTFPEHYEEDIEDYGMERLRAEFPDLAK